MKKDKIKSLIKKAKNGDKRAEHQLASHVVHTPELFEKFMQGISYEELFQSTAEIYLKELIPNLEKIGHRNFKIEVREKDGFQYPYIEGIQIHPISAGGKSVFVPANAPLEYRWMALACTIHEIIADRMFSLGALEVSSTARSKEYDLKCYLSKIV
jgi:hypothetical protein